MSKKIKFVVVGCGHIGKRHATIITNNPGCQLVALCDLKAFEDPNLSSFSVPLFNSIEDLFASNLEYDVVTIATPNGYHEDQSVMALKNGKHVIIEKPMALTKKGCENILFTALNHQKLVFCVMQNRYSPPTQWLKNLIQKEQALGQIYMVQINCFWNRDDRYYTGKNWHGDRFLDGGTLYTQFSHFIDILYWLFGDITNIKTKIKDFNHSKLTDFEDSGVVSFDFISGGIGSLNFSTSVWNSNLESSITIIAENGSVKVGGQYMNEVEVCNIKNYTMPLLPPSNPPNDYGPYKGSAANHHYIYENVIEVLNGSSPITTNALEGMKIVEIIENIYHSTY